MNASLLISRLGGRFHPATHEQFNNYAEHLEWVVGIRGFQPRETLASVYQYRNVSELEQVLKMPGTPGPFDDAIPEEIRGMGRVQRAIAIRNARAMDIVIDRIDRCLLARPSSFTIRQLCALKLFSSPLAHYAAFSSLLGKRNSTYLAHFAVTH